MLRNELICLTDMTRRAFPIPQEAQAVANFVIASVIARQLSLPSSPVESDAKYFADTYADKVAEIAGIAGNLVMVNVGEILSMTRLVWCYRYQAVFSRAYPNPAFFDLDLTAFNADLGKANADNKVRDFLRQYSAVFCKVNEEIETCMQAGVSA